MYILHRSISVLSFVFLTFLPRSSVSNGGEDSCIFTLPTYPANVIFGRSDAASRATPMSSALEWYMESSEDPANARMISTDQGQSTHFAYVHGKLGIELFNAQMARPSNDANDHPSA
jgi:hypothetical protein